MAVLKPPCGKDAQATGVVSHDTMQTQFNFLYSLVNEVPDPVLVIGTDFRVKFANRAAQNFSNSFVCKADKEPFCHTLVYNVDYQCSKVGRPCPLIEVLESNKPVVVEHEIEVGDGMVRNYEIHASPLWDDEGHFLGIVESIRDITDRTAYAHMLKKSQMELESSVEERTRDLLRSNDILRNEIVGRQNIEKILRAERDKFQVMLEAMGQGMHILNPDFTIEYQNDVLRELFGDQIGHTCYEVYKGRDNPCEVCRMHDAISTGHVQRTETIMRNNRYYSQSYAPFKDIDGTFKCLILLNDITEEKMYQAETMRTGQLASIGELAAGVAHEINNPINGIINFSQILIDDSGNDSTKQILQRIIDEGERVAIIVSKLLSFARQGGDEATAYLAIEARDVLADSFALLGHQYKKDGIHYTIAGPDNELLVWVNPQQLQQVFVNILSNARFALNEKFKNQRSEDKRLEVTFALVEIKGKRFVRISFTDFGCGIPEEIIDSVCNPFFSTKQPGEGTGLGLSISQGIVKEFKGHLRIKSELGRYTTIMVELPYYEGREGNNHG
jgi:signal transduction histidine kinase